MNLVTDLFWMAGAALSIGFLAYGAFLLLFVPRSVPLPVALRLRLAS